jgi:hypothetical protein
MHPRRGTGQPLSEAELPPILWSHQQNLGGPDEESSQITTASLEYAAQDRTPSGAVG